MTLATPVAIFSQISVIINAAAFSALGFGDSSKQFEGRVLMSIFSSSFIANIVILLLPAHCNSIGFTKQVMALCAEIALFFLSYQYSSNQKLKSVYFLISIWVPAMVLLALALHQREDTFHMSIHGVCAKDYTKATMLWMGIEIFRMFLSSMALSLSMLVLVFNDPDKNAATQSARAKNMFRLLYVAIFDNCILLISGILNMGFSMNQYLNDIRVISLMHVIMFCHYVCTPILFLMVYSRIIHYSKTKGKQKTTSADITKIRVVDSRPYYGHHVNGEGSNSSLLRGS